MDGIKRNITDAIRHPEVNRDYPIVGVIQSSVFDRVKYLVKFKGMTLEAAIEEQGLLPDELKDRIRTEAQRW